MTPHTVGKLTTFHSAVSVVMNNSICNSTETKKSTALHSGIIGRLRVLVVVIPSHQRLLFAMIVVAMAREIPPTEMRRDSCI